MDTILELCTRESRGLSTTSRIAWLGGTATIQLRGLRCRNWCSRRVHEAGLSLCFRRECERRIFPNAIAVVERADERRNVLWLSLGCRDLGTLRIDVAIAP